MCALLDNLYDDDDDEILDKVEKASEIKESVDQSKPLDRVGDSVESNGLEKKSKQVKKSSSKKTSNARQELARSLHEEFNRRKQKKTNPTVYIKDVHQQYLDYVEEAVLKPLSEYGKEIKQISTSSLIQMAMEYCMEQISSGALDQDKILELYVNNRVGDKRSFAGNR